MHDYSNNSVNLKEKKEKDNIHFQSSNHPNLMIKFYIPRPKLLPCNTTGYITVRSVIKNKSIITSSRCLFNKADIQCNASIRVASHSLDNWLKNGTIQGQLGTTRFMQNKYSNINFVNSKTAY